MYFSDEDYTIFTKANALKKDSALQNKRKALQNKMIRLHEMIYHDVQALGLDCHDSKANITSSITPDRHRGDYHTWILVRYGKLIDEYDFLKPEFGFTKHSNIQFVVDEKGFEVQLFLGNDKYYDFLNIRKAVAEYRDIIEEEIKKLYDLGWTWCFYDEPEPFKYDISADGSFCDWLLRNINRGGDAYITYSYGKHDERLSENNIAGTVLSDIKLLVRLYNALTRRKKYL